MPAEMPELVTMFPSTTHLAFAAQLTFGPVLVAHLYARLFVVARLPSSTPARAKIVAPVQTERTAFRLGYIFLTNSISSATSPRTPTPPGTMRTSIASSLLSPSGDDAWMASCSFKVRSMTIFSEKRYRRCDLAGMRLVVIG